MKMLRSTLAGVALVVGVSGVAGMGQRQSSSSTTSTQTQIPPASRGSYPGMPMPMGASDPSSPPDYLSIRTAEQQAKNRNSERQKRLEADTDKLVGLVTDLKEQVQGDKVMSPAELGKKAEEIEKLAKSVKERMKG